MTRIVLDLDNSARVVLALATVIEENGAAGDVTHILDLIARIKVATKPDARQLIALDPEALDWPKENRDKTLELARMIRLMCDSDGPSYRSCMVRQIADVIDPPKPARIPEPVWWGVVLAGDEMRDCWIHDRLSGGLQWVCLDTRRRSAWADLIDPTLIRDGIEVTS